MQTATRKDPGRIAEPDNDALLSELGVLYPVMTFTGPADAWEAPSGSSIEQGQGYEEQRSELDERILAGLVRA